MPRRAVFTAMLILSFLGGAVCLYYGSVMLLFVPGYPDESYWQRERIIYGVFPVGLSAVFFLAGLALKSLLRADRLYPERPKPSLHKGPNPRSKSLR